MGKQTRTTLLKKGPFLGSVACDDWTEWQSAWSTTKDLTCKAALVKRLGRQISQPGFAKSRNEIIECLLEVAERLFEDLQFADGILWESDKPTIVEARNLLATTIFTTVQCLGWDDDDNKLRDIHFAQGERIKRILTLLSNVSCFYRMPELIKKDQYRRPTEEFLGRLLGTLWGMHEVQVYEAASRWQLWQLLDKYRNRGRTTLYSCLLKLLEETAPSEVTSLMEAFGSQNKPTVEIAAQLVLSAGASGIKEIRFREK